MLPKKSKSISRLISSFKQKEIKEFFAKARLLITIDGLEIRVAPKIKEYARILIVTPKKSGTAPQRNRIRRRIKNIFYEEKLFQEPSDCIIIVKSEAMKLTFQQLKNLLITYLGKEQ